MADRHRKEMQEREKRDGPKPTTCEACGKQKPLVWDHNHTTGLFRGWICKWCNTALGLIYDDPQIALKLAQYLISKSDR